MLRRIITKLLPQTHTKNLTATKSCKSSTSGDDNPVDYIGKNFQSRIKDLEYYNKSFRESIQKNEIEIASLKQALSFLEGEKHEH